MTKRTAYGTKVFLLPFPKIQKKKKTSVGSFKNGPEEEVDN